MLAAHHFHDPTTRNMEQKLANTMVRAYDSNGQVREGFFNLTRRMENEEEDQFDVDLTILDFLVYKATATVFEWQAMTDKYESDLPNALVTMTAEWRSFLSQRHKGRHLSNVATFRSRLLQFVLLLTHRYHPSQTWTNKESLQRLRAQNRSRSNVWYQRNERRDAPVCNSLPYNAREKDTRRNREQRAEELNMPLAARTWIVSPRDRPTLYTLLPLFMDLTAARCTLPDEWTPSSDWFDLAGQYILQAVVEECVLYGTKGETFNDVFAFGGSGVGTEDEDGDGKGVQKLFHSENGREERKEWTKVKQKYMSELLDSDGRATFERAQKRHPYVHFEERLLSFLEYLHNDLVKPDLVQVEEGRIVIDGNELAEKESRDMIERMML